MSVFSTFCWPLPAADCLAGACLLFCVCAMQLACQETLAANAVPAARAALFKLLGILQQEQQQQAAAAAGDVEAAVSTKIGSSNRTGSSSAGQVSEGWVLRALVKLDSDEIDRHIKLLQAANARAAAVADGDMREGHGSQQSSCGKETAAAQTLQQGGAAEGQPGSDAAAAAVAAATAGAAKCAVQLSEVLQAAVSRARVLGLEALSGDKEAEGCRLLEWMSTMAWNAALQVTGRGPHAPA